MTVSDDEVEAAWHGGRMAIGKPWVTPTEADLIGVRAALSAAAKVRAIREGDGLLSAVIALIEDDMYGPGEAEGVPEREAFNRACRRQVNRITSRLIVAPKLNATQEGK